MKKVPYDGHLDQLKCLMMDIVGRPFLLDNTLKKLRKGCDKDKGFANTRYRVELSELPFLMCLILKEMSITEMKKKSDRRNINMMR